MKDEIIKSLLKKTDEEREILKRGSKIDRSLYMQSEKNVINAEKLLSQGKLITVRPHTRFVHFPEHTHDYIEAIYMCSGKTEHIINGEHITLNQGELLFLSQNARQEIMPASQNDIAVNFIILPEFFDKTLLMLESEESPIKKFMIDCILNSESHTPYLHFKVADLLPIQNLVENLVWTLLNNVQNKRSINQSTMGLLILQLLNHTDKLTYINPDEQLVMQVLSYIEEHYKSCSLNELANSLHYDFTWLSREIKRRTGKTYTELLHNKRMSQAAYLLRNTHINIDEIALQTGYENISYFHRLFYKTYGKTPRAYRFDK
ncbi:MAG: helix-turn-helix domain-containing protein [Clostridia bacterium]|nr:helix-turn-helix domain-containing protein [Clostridia bacterium]